MALHLLKHQQTIGVRQHHIQHHQRDFRVFIQQRQRIFSLMAAEYGKNMFTQYIVQQFAYRAIVIHYQNCGLHYGPLLLWKG
ncbi:hypothetical protein L579_2787 [Pantoea sp. AS-PWVM4]|nr:hypothetical protein L579_2787 [Pantoea sp. AS-PWVM4]